MPRLKTYLIIYWMVVLAIFAKIYADVRRGYHLIKYFIEPQKSQFTYDKHTFSTYELVTTSRLKFLVSVTKSFTYKDLSKIFMGNKTIIVKYSDDTWQYSLNQFGTHLYIYSHKNGNIKCIYDKKINPEFQADILGDIYSAKFMNELDDLPIQVIMPSMNIKN